MRKKISRIFCCSLLSLCFISFASFGQADNKAASLTNVKLGLAYLQRGMYAASKDALLSALREDPNRSSAWYSMAYYLEKTGDPQTAEKYYLRAIKIKPDSGSAKNNYGTFLCRVGREQQGIQEFLAAANEPSYLNAAGAYENAGTCALMMHNKVMAMHYFHKALDNNPSMPFSLLSLARLNHQRGDEVSAKKYFADFKNLELSNKSTAIIKQYHDYVFSNTSTKSTV